MTLFNGLICSVLTFDIMRIYAQICKTWPLTSQIFRIKLGIEDCFQEMDEKHHGQHTVGRSGISNTRTRPERTSSSSRAVSSVIATVRTLSLEKLSRFYKDNCGKNRHFPGA